MPHAYSSLVSCPLTQHQTTPPHTPTPPKDIEYAVEAGLESILRPGCSGSFAHDVGGEETVAYVAELRNSTTDKALLQDACDQVRRIIADQFQVRVDRFD